MKNLVQVPVEVILNLCLYYCSKELSPLYCSFIVDEELGAGSSRGHPEFVCACHTARLLPRQAPCVHTH